MLSLVAAITCYYEIIISLAASENIEQKLTHAKEHISTIIIRLKDDDEKFTDSDVLVHFRLVSDPTIFDKENRTLAEFPFTEWVVMNPS